MEKVVLNGVARTDMGKKATKSVRNEELVPCIIYGGTENINFSCKPLDLRDLVYTSSFKRAEINVDGKSYSCILKSVQFHPVSEKIMHVDFLELVKGKKLKVEIPLRFTGNAAGVKAGGKLLSLVRKLKVKTTPEKLINEIKVDVSHLELGQVVRVRDIVQEDGIEIMNASGIPLAIVEIPRALRGAQAATAEK